MKMYLFTCFCVFAFISLKAQNTDLPGPVANLQTLPSGSYVIAMDNTFQVNSSGDFNLKAYGLIVYLLNNNIRIKWSIKAGKAKDGIDFTATAEQIRPTLISGGISRDFKAGPFIINAADTAGVSALIDHFYSASSLTGANRPQVYRLTANALNVDIRYDLTAFRPKAAVLTDGGNQNIHLAYMTAAAIPPENYATSIGNDLITNCFTFASEPHNTKTGTAVNNAISAIKDFVLKGGNFLAQCEAIANYENNSLGRFQTTSGITIANTNINTNLIYPNPDLSFSQFDGAYNGSLGGSLKNWKIVGSPANNEHDHATGTGPNSSAIGASVSKHYYQKGGLVFYLGNHSFATSSLAGINGIRMYMNAFLTPSNTNCPSQIIALPVKLLTFSAKIQDDKIKLNWNVSENQKIKRFDVERSLDGVNFATCGTIAGTNKTGNEAYIFSENSFAPRLFYRLKLMDKQGGMQYSAIIVIAGGDNNLDRPTILTNPIKEDLIFTYRSAGNATINVHVYNSMGGLMYAGKINCTNGINQVIISGNYVRAKDTYIVVVTDDVFRRWTFKMQRL